MSPFNSTQCSLLVLTYEHESLLFRFSRFILVCNLKKTLKMSKIQWIRTPTRIDNGVKYGYQTKLKLLYKRIMISCTFLIDYLIVLIQGNQLAKEYAIAIESYLSKPDISPIKLELSLSHQLSVQVTDANQLVSTTTANVERFFGDFFDMLNPLRSKQNSMLQFSLTKQKLKEEIWDGGSEAQFNFPTFPNCYLGILVFIYHSILLSSEGSLLESRTQRVSIPNLNTPTVSASSNLIFNLSIRYFNFVQKLWPWISKPIWHIGVIKGTVNDILGLGPFQIEKIDTSSSYVGLADPFIIKQGGKNWIFLEGINDSGKGEIAVSTLHSSEFTACETVLTIDSHLSFPFIFSYGGKYFMIPESSKSNANIIYQCQSFPYEWSKLHSILPEYRIVDPIIFQRGGLWWLLFSANSLTPLGKYSEMYAFYSESPISGDWNKHNCNPLFIDFTRGRNGGFFSFGGENYRVSQEYSDGKYGQCFRVHQILSLTPSEYQEKALLKSSAPSGFNLHHFSTDGLTTIVDYMSSKQDKHFSIVLLDETFD